MAVVCPQVRTVVIVIDRNQIVALRGPTTLVAPVRVVTFLDFYFPGATFGQVKTISSPALNPVQQPAIKAVTTPQCSGCRPSEVVTTWIFEWWSWTSVSKGSTTLGATLPYGFNCFNFFLFFPWTQAGTPPSCSDENKNRALKRQQFFVSAGVLPRPNYQHNSLKKIVNSNNDWTFMMI